MCLLTWLLIHDCHLPQTPFNMTSLSNHEHTSLRVDLRTNQSLEVLSQCYLSRSLFVVVCTSRVHLFCTAIGSPVSVSVADKHPHAVCSFEDRALECVDIQLPFWKGMMMTHALHAVPDD